MRELPEHIEQSLLVRWVGDNWISQNMPDAVWAQVLLGLEVLAALVVVAGWITSRVLAKITRLALTAIGQDDSSVALSLRRDFRNVRFYVPLLVILFNIGLLTIDGKYTTLPVFIFFSEGFVFF